MSQTPPPHIEGYARYIAAMQMVNGPETPEQLELRTALWDEPGGLPPLQCLKSLDDLDEEADEDDDELEDLDEDEEEDDLDEEYDEDEDEEEDEEDDDDEDEDEDEEEDDGGVKPLKMA